MPQKRIPLEEYLISSVIFNLGGCRPPWQSRGRIPGPVQHIMANRQCTFEIDNKCSDYSFCNPQVFTYSGIYEKPLSPTLGPSESGSALFTKTANTACGAVGVLTYDLQNKSTEKCVGKMAVMFSVPHDYNFYSNLYAVGVFDVNTKCDNNLYKEMYYGAGSVFVRGKAKESLTYKGEHVTIRATMSDSKTSVIKVHVSN